MKILVFLFVLLFTVPAAAGGCSKHKHHCDHHDHKTTVKLKDNNDGFWKGVGVALIAGGITCSLIDGCRAYFFKPDEPAKPPPPEEHDGIQFRKVQPKPLAFRQALP